METKMLRNMMIVVLLALGAMQATAVDYKNQYRGVQNTEYRVQAVSNQSSAVSIQTSAPSATFQSTSAYSGQWQDGSATPMLNSDGSINSGAYMGGSNRGRKDGIGSPGGGINPPDDDDDDDTENGTPIGDGLWVLMLLAGAYIAVRRARAARLARSSR